MIYKVHWIIDGLTEVDVNNQEEAEKIIQDKIKKFVEENSIFFNNIGATAIQGKAYLPGKDEK